MAAPHSRRPHDSRPSDSRRPGEPHRQRDPRPAPDETVLLYGLHTVTAALANPRRRALKLMATRNALARLEEHLADAPAGVAALARLTPEIVEPRAIDRLLPADAVHQGVALTAEPLDPVGVADLAGARLIVALDQLTDPHNVGAIMRSAVALGAGGLVTTTRHAARESGALAKAASGAADLLPHATVGSLTRALADLKAEGFTIIGLDSEGESDLESVPVGRRAVLVLGSEGKGLRPGVREVTDAMARLEAPGPLASLNVSNAAAIALYVVGRRLGPG